MRAFRHSLALPFLTRIGTRLVAATILLASGVVSAAEYQVQILPWDQLSRRFDIEATPVAVSMTVATSTRLDYGCINVVFTVRGTGRVDGPGGLLAVGLAGPKKVQQRIVSALTSGFFQVLPKLQPLPGTPRDGRYLTSLAMPVWGSKFRKSLSPASIESAEAALREACAVPDLANQVTTGKLPLSVDLPQLGP